jgi:hypothetical protein
MGAGKTRHALTVYFHSCVSQIVSSRCWRSCTSVAQGEIPTYQSCAHRDALVCASILLMYLEIRLSSKFIAVNLL